MTLQEIQKAMKYYEEYKISFGSITDLTNHDVAYKCMEQVLAKLSMQNEKTRIQEITKEVEKIMVKINLPLELEYVDVNELLIQWSELKTQDEKNIISVRSVNPTYDDTDTPMQIANIIFDYFNNNILS